MTTTIVAPATPIGRSALGMVRLSGPLCNSISKKLFEGQQLQPRLATPLTLYDSDGAIDQVVVVYWKAPFSSTGEDLLEITSHGSPEIMRQIVDLCTRHGAHLAQPGEFTRRAFTSGKIDLSQAEAIQALIAAKGDKTRRAAIDRLSGGLSRIITSIRNPILVILSLLEARLDHPDEDIPFLYNADTLSQLNQIENSLDSLLNAIDRGRIENEGFKICLMGNPNVGKSSLLNALVGRDRAIVTPLPGTTRDTLEEPVQLNGLFATLIDTAGLRNNASDPAEIEGINRTFHALNSCDVAILVDDATTIHQQPQQHSEPYSLVMNSGRPYVIAYNKSDLVLDRSRLSNVLSVSAKTGEGLSNLVDHVLRAANKTTSEEGDRMLVCTRDRLEIVTAKNELALAIKMISLDDKTWEDRVCHHLRCAYTHLGYILGVDATEEVLNSIFSRFCVGK